MISCIVIDFHEEVLHHVGVINVISYPAAEPLRPMRPSSHTCKLKTPQVVRDEVASHDNTWNCFITSIFRRPFIKSYCHLPHQVGWPLFSSIMLSPRCASQPVSRCLRRLNAPRQWIPASSQVRLKETYSDLKLDSHWLLLSPKWAQSKSYAVQAPKERIAKFKGTKGSNVGHIHPAVSIAGTASFQRNFTKDTRSPYWQPCNSKGKYTVTLIEGDGIGPEISKSVKDIFAAAKVGQLIPLADQRIIFTRPQSIGNRLTSHHNLKMGKLLFLTRQFKAWRRTILLWKDPWRSARGAPWLEKRSIS